MAGHVGARGRRDALWLPLVVVLAGTVLACGVVILPTAVLRAAWYVAFDLAAMAMVSVGVRRYRPQPRLPWYVGIAAFGFLALTDAAEVVHLAAPSATWVPFAAAVFAVGGFVGAIGSSLRSLGNQGRGVSREAVLDALIVLLPTGLLVWHVFSAPSGSELGRMLGGAQTDVVLAPLVDVAVLVLIAHHAVSLHRGNHRVLASSWFLLVGLAIRIVGAMGSVDAARHGSVLPGGWQGVVELVSDVTLAAAALHPSMLELTRPRRRRDRGWPLLSLGAGMALGPVLLFVWSPHAQGRALVLAGAIAVVILGLVRVNGISRARVEAAGRLADQQARFDRLVENSSEGVLVLDARGVVRYQSLASQRLLAYPETELAGRPLADLVHSDDLPAVAGMLADVMAGAHAMRSAEVRLRHADGSWRWQQATAANLLEDPTVGGIVINHYDVTQTHALEEERRLLQSAVLHATDGMLIVKTEPGTVPMVTYVNPAFARMTGLDPEELTGQAVDRACGCEDQKEEALQRLLDPAGEPFSGECVRVRTDGSTFVEERRLAPIRDEHGVVRYWVAITRDVTEHRLAREALEHTLAAERDVVERLRLLDAMKNTFLSAVSHELRTPLAAILGLALTLQRGRGTLPEPTAEELMERLVANAHKLERLLADLLDVGRLHRGEVAPQRRRVDVLALADAVVADLEPSAAARVEVARGPVEAWVDRVKVERIIDNLVRNSLRHGGAGARVWVDAYRAGDATLLVVDDDGPGVPELLREHVFEPFRQAHSLANHDPGLGIGLSLVREFAALHAGRAWAAERPGGGGRFCVLLPDGQEARTEPMPVVLPAAALS